MQISTSISVGIYNIVIKLLASIAYQLDQVMTAPEYGFLYKKTNVFYAFEPLEEYQRFIAWF